MQSLEEIRRGMVRRPAPTEVKAAIDMFAPPAAAAGAAALPEPYSVPNGGEVEKAMRWLGKFMPGETLALLRDSFLVGVDCGLAYLAGVCCEVELDETGHAVRTALPEFGAVLRQADRLAALWTAYHQARR